MGWGTSVGNSGRGPIPSLFTTDHQLGGPAQAGVHRRPRPRQVCTWEAPPQAGVHKGGPAPGRCAQEASPQQVEPRSGVSRQSEDLPLQPFMCQTSLIPSGEQAPLEASGWRCPALVSIQVLLSSAGCPGRRRGVLCLMLLTLPGNQAEALQCTCLAGRVWPGLQLLCAGPGTPSWEAPRMWTAGCLA